RGFRGGHRVHVKATGAERRAQIGAERGRVPRHQLAGLTLASDLGDDGRDQVDRRDPGQDTGGGFELAGEGPQRVGPAIWRLAPSDAGAAEPATPRTVRALA